jgi:multiple sugar transport system permease protein
MTANATPATSVAAAVAPRHRSRVRWQRVVLHLFLISLSLVWLFPILWTAFTALRPYGDVIKDGAVSFPRTLNFDNFVTAWTVGDLPVYFINTLIIAVPGVILTLWISSMLGFIFARFSFRANLLLLMMFTAGNLLPPQVIIVPLYRMYLALPLPVPLSDHGVLYDSYFGIILIHVIFQTGFCTFVLSNYMKTISRELTEAALVDGASIWTIYRRVILPLCRPALAALAVLEFTFMYNDFFWALILMVTGNKRPITSALNNFQGSFFTDQNVLAAMSLIVAVPTIVVYLVLSKQFVRGLTLGSTKG